MSSATNGSAQSADHNSTADGSGFDWESFIRNTALIVVLIVLLWVAFNVELPAMGELQDQIAAWGWAAWLVFIGIYAVVALTPIPVSIMAVTGGLLFGVFAGSILSVIGVLIGCWGGYWLARGLGHQATAKLLGSHFPKIERHLNEASVQAVAMLRLLPGFPYWPINYGSGALGVSQRDYVLASAVSVIPGQVSLAAVGSFISTPSLINGIVVGVAWAIVAGLTVWAYRRWNAARPENEPEEDESA